MRVAGRDPRARDGLELLTRSGMLLRLMAWQFTRGLVPSARLPPTLARRRRQAALAATVIVGLTACFPTPAPQHAVWAPGVRLDVPMAPLPGLARQEAEPDADEASGTSLSWPGLLGGRIGYGNRRVRGAVGAHVGLTLYGDASLAVRLAQAGRMYVALAGEVGVGAAGLSSAAVTNLGQMIGVDDLDGAFTWARLRPLISRGPRSPTARGDIFTLGGVLGTFAGVRELGFSLGYIKSTYDRGRYHDGEPYENRDDRKGGGFDIYVLWHGEASRPSILLTLNLFLGWTKDTDE